MSLKRFIVFLFLLFQLTHGQNITLFGLQFPAWGATQLKTNAIINNTTVLLHTNSSSGKPAILADVGHTSSMQVTAKPLGQNITFFGFKFPTWGATQVKTNSTITNTTVLLHTDSPPGKPTILADAGHMSIVQVTEKPLGQNIPFFGFKFPSWGATQLKTNSSSAKPTILADAGHTSSVQVSAKPITQTTKTPGWNQLFSSIDLNDLRSNFVRTPPDLNTLKLILITRKHCNNIHNNPVCKFTKTSYGLGDKKALMKDEHFKIDRKTVIYFPGYTDNLSTDATQLIIDAYLQRNDHNLFFCDYQEGQSLKSDVLNIEIKAQAIAKMIYKLNAIGLDLSLLHLVGHSLGAQMAGSVGKSFIDLTEGAKTIKRITGLDPAFLFFYPPIGRHITAKDALFVDIIHTDAWAYGAPVATGSVDFWPNGGSGSQPGCLPRDNKILTKLDTCSHYRAVRFYAESLLTENAFMTMKCPSWYKFKQDMCQPKVTAYMGYDAKPGITGNYYLRTNHQQPFTRKHHGVIFDFVD